MKTNVKVGSGRKGSGNNKKKKNKNKNKIKLEALDKATREQKMRAEEDQAKRENEFYLQNVQKARAIEKTQERKKKKAQTSSSLSSSSGSSSSVVSSSSTSNQVDGLKRKATEPLHEESIKKKMHTSSPTSSSSASLSSFDVLKQKFKQRKPVVFESKETPESLVKKVFD